jgi:soluble cytochrome b562
MDTPKYKIDKTKLTPEQQDKLDTYYQTQDQLKTLQDLADMTQELVNLATDTKENTGKLEALGAVLTDAREQLVKLNAKEAPDAPEFAKPMNDMVVRLEKALKALDVKPQVNVAAPNVDVAAPDLTEFTRILRTEIPKAFDKAIKSIPKVEVSPPDNTELLKVWEGISEQLQSIDTATRMKPIQGSMKVVNPDGTSTADVNLKQTNTILFATISASSSGDNQIVAANATKKIKLLSCALVASGTVSVKWRSGTTDVSGTMPLVVNSGFVLPASSPGQGHYLETAVNTALNINLSGAIQVSGHISYYLEA